ncbi:MAG: hypothetical protein JO128_01070 [Alphaproteobacteria bacterium]|nr:hypothetical protein [Alphaproteobacteria bacterium]
MPSRLIRRLALAAALVPAAAAAQPPDYNAFKTKVEPVFLKKRVGHARCVVCHAGANNAFHLERLSPGAKTWTDEQSRKNFEVVSALAAPGDDTAPLLRHPLAPEAGGDAFHSGGRQFASKNDPDWKILARWVRGAKEK